MRCLWAFIFSNSDTTLKRRIWFLIWFQIGRCHQSSRYDFVANFSADVWVSRKIEKEKDEAVNHYWEQEKVANKIVVWQPEWCSYTEYYPV